jgi:exopolysaccharide production protein ExoZ
LAWAPTPVKLLTLTSLLAIPILFAAPALWTNVSRIFTCGLSAVVVVTGAVLLERWGWRIRSALVMAVGDASYILYLSHPYITQVVQKLGLRIHATGLVSVALIVGCIALVVVVSLVLHAKVDRPLSRAVRRVLLVQRMQARPA